MKNIFEKNLLIVFFMLQFSCKSINISPKQGTVTVPAKGEIRIWENIEHNSFVVHLENKSTTNSCEAYTVNNNYEKWIAPSLLAQSRLDFTVPSDGSILLKNFSDENLTINYTID